MINKLNPPSVAAILPAFTGNSLIIPFQLNKTVSKDMIDTAAVRLYDAYGVLLDNRVIVKELLLDLNNLKLTIIFNDNVLVVGAFYKIQMAFISNIFDDTVGRTVSILGYYSTMIIVKYTSSPTVGIAEYESTKHTFNNYLTQLSGTYAQTDDLDELLYSSHYVISDKNFNELYKSPEKIHNFLEDAGSIQIENIDFTVITPQINEVYYIQFFTTSLNGLMSSSEKYRVIKTHTSLIPSGFLENDVFFIKKDDVTSGLKLTVEKNTSGRIDSLYLITRYDIDNNVYQDLGIKHIVAKKSESWSWIDWSAEQGKNYKYSLSRFTGKLYSNPYWSNELFFDFEDMMLIDADFILKIRYNGNIKNIKNNLQETKIESIGGQYPMFFRNGNLKYKEFSIEGLIYYEDFSAINESRTFTSPSVSSATQGTAWAQAIDVKQQREFKLKVLEWLNNGKNKLLKTSTEGTFFVRLMNTSLVPDMVSGRKYHSFSTTAYESAPVTMSTLHKNGLLQFDSSISQIPSIGTWNLLEYPSGEIILNKDYYVSNIEAKDLPIGTMIELTDIDGYTTRLYFQSNGFIGVPDKLYTMVKICGNQKQGQLDFTYCHDVEIDTNDTTLADIKYSLGIIETFTNQTSFLESTLYKEYFHSDNSNKIALIDLTSVVLEKQPGNYTSASPYVMIINDTEIDLASVDDGSFNMHAYGNFDLLEDLAQATWGEGVQVTICYYTCEFIYKDEAKGA